METQSFIINRNITQTIEVLTQEKLQEIDLFIWATVIILVVIIATAHGRFACCYCNSNLEVKLEATVAAQEVGVAEIEEAAPEIQRLRVANLPKISFREEALA